MAIVPAVTVNVAVVLLEETVTEAGVVNMAESSESATVAPPAFETVAVQVEVPPDPRLPGLHARPVKVMGATSEMAAVAVLPFSVAVTVAV